MRDDPVDLTPLDPDADPGAEDRFVGAVMARIATQPNLYPPQVDILWGAWSLARPVLIAASIAIVVAGIVIARGDADDGAPRTVAESVGVPPMFGLAAAESSGGSLR
jgi:hypothetical protein